MKYDHVICRPVVVNVLDLDYSTDTPALTIKGKIIIVGSVPDNIRSDITNGKVSSHLKKYFGDNVKQLHLGGITGGDLPDDLEDEFDDITLEDLILENSSKPSKSGVMKLKNKPIEFDSKGSIIYNYDVQLFKEDNIKEFKDKLFLATGIDYFKQHVYFKLKKTVNTVGYTFMMDDNVIDTDLVNLDYSIPSNLLLNIPIDKYIYSMQDSIYILNNELTTSLDYYLDQKGEFYVISVDSFIAKQNIKKNIEQMIKIDIEQFDLLYYSFINKYFPVMTKQVFLEYIVNESDLEHKYPDLYSDKSILSRRYDAEKTILLENNNVDLKTESFNRQYDIKINSISIHTPLVYIEDILNPHILFDVIELSKYPSINFIELNIQNDYEITNIYKLNNNSRKYEYPDLGVNQLFLSVKIVDSSREIFKLSNLYMDTIIYPDGVVNVSAKFPTTIILSKDDFIDLVIENINPILVKLNNANSKIHLIFGSDSRIPLFLKKKISFNSISISLIYGNIIPEKTLYKMISSLISAGIISRRTKSALEHDYIINKGITSHDMSKLDVVGNILSNQYSYLSSDYAREVFISHLFNKKTISIKYNYINVIFMINNISVSEIPYIVDLLKARLHLMPLPNEPTKKSEINTIYMLKNNDPKLFDYKSNRTKYSRICQKKFQPHITNEKEIKDKNINNYIKYWNFSKNIDEYYYCPNKKYNFVGFVTDVHPNNYCLPCCKKLEKKDSKYVDCLENRTHEEKVNNKSTIRYISKYISNSSIRNRITELPEDLIELLNKQSYMNLYIYGMLEHTYKNMENIDLVIIYSDIYSNSTTTTNTGESASAARSYKREDISDFIITILRFLNNNTYVFDLLLDGSLKTHFSNMKDLVSSITNYFLRFKLFDNKFSDWNELFMDIMYYYGVNTILFTDEYNPSRGYQDNRINIRYTISSRYVTIDQIFKNNNNLLLLHTFDTKLDRYIYIPIYDLNKNTYFSYYKIERKIFDNSSPVIKSVQNMIKYYLKSTTESYVKLFTLDNIILYLNSQSDPVYTLQDLYVDSNSCYAVGLTIKSLRASELNKYLYLSIDNTLIEDHHKNDYTLCSHIFTINDTSLSAGRSALVVSLKDIISFIRGYNLFIYNESKLKLPLFLENIQKYKLYNLTYSNIQERVDNKKNTIISFDIDHLDLLYNTLMINKFIINDNVVIGVEYNNMHAYINPPITIIESLNILKTNIKHIRTVVQCRDEHQLKQLVTRHINLSDSNNIRSVFDPKYNSLIGEYSIYYRQLLYHPLKINTDLYKIYKSVNNVQHKQDPTNITDIITLTKPKILIRGIYNKNIYNEFMILFMRTIKISRNNAIRKYIISLLSGYKKDYILNLIHDISHLHTTTLYQVIYKNIQNVYNLPEESLNYISYRATQQLVKLMSLNKQNIMHDYKQAISNIINIINNNLFEFDNINIEEIKYMKYDNLIKTIKKNIESKIIILSASDFNKFIDETNPGDFSMYKKTKLIIIKNLYETLVKSMASDINNPYKRRYILSNAFITANTIDSSFTQYPNEVIYMS